jgi:predicted O-methyltransferase YrrM
MTGGGSSIPEVQALLRVLAGGARRAAEVGTAFGEGAAAIAEGISPEGTLVTVEADPERAKIAREALAGFPNVRLVEGDWRELLPLGPFDFLFLDVHEPKTDPLVLELVAPGGLVVIDDLTPGRAGPDPVRDFWLRGDGASGVEILTTPTTAAILATRRLSPRSRSSAPGTRAR